DRFELEFDQPQFAVALGQSAVLYDGDRLLGGGVISARG
ncbi:MAG TPA: aminomethyltransferase beta-barrel domain-containing protein, partial [Trueperaceae bacterium]|nr:aminomethyltransferase beta-barrel domain-containing protein [Trueperaceae bacterium]